MFPKLFAGLWIKRQQIRVNWPIGAATAMHWLVALEDLQEKLSVVDGWAGAVCPLVGKRTVIFLNIASPQFFAGEIKRGEGAISIIEEHEFAIGHRRRRGEIAFVVETVTDAHLLVPQHFAVLTVKTQRAHGFGSIIGGADEDLIGPNNGGRGRYSWQGRGPPDIPGFGELGRQTFFLARTVEIGTAPLWPIPGAQRGGDADRQGEGHE